MVLAREYLIKCLSLISCSFYMPKYADKMKPTIQTFPWIGNAQISSWAHPAVVVCIVPERKRVDIEGGAKVVIKFSIFNSINTKK